MCLTNYWLKIKISVLFLCYEISHDNIYTRTYINI